MKVGSSIIIGNFGARSLITFSVAVAALLISIGLMEAGTLFVPNGSFESPLVPPEVPYASTNMDYWQKSPQPVWYDPSQNQDAPWDSLMGQFFNVPFPGLFIENCEGNQASFLFAVPEVALFQDYNTTPTHAFNAKFNVGSSYDLGLGVIGGGGSMQPGATLQISLYYRDASSNKVIAASTSITNSLAAFPTNTHFVDFQVHLPTVKSSDPWAGQNIGIQVQSTTGFELAGGYWDLDNVRLTETAAPVLALGSPTIANAQISFTVLSEPGLQFEIQASTNFPAVSGDWIQIGTFTNVTGATVFTDSTTNFNRRYYRTRQL